MRLVALVGLALSLLGCEDPLKSVELVAEPRLLGARVEVDGDPGRAAPAPGELATLRFLLASPDGRASFGYALSACSAALRQGGRAGCSAAPFVQVTRENRDQSGADWRFEVPRELEPSGRVLLVGVVCPDGSPRSETSCDGSHPGVPLQLELELAREGDANRNPELQAESIDFDGQAWTELGPDEGDGDCGGFGLPEADVGSAHTLTVRLDESDRDPLPRPSRLDPSRESLQLSHFVSEGDISRAFETVSWESDELERRATWTAPDAPGIVRFWFVLRDFRGGAAFVERAVCVR